MDVESTSAAAPSEGAAARRPIGEFLVERGLVTEEQLKQALAEQRSSGKRLGEILVERGAITRMALASVLGEQWEEAGRHLRAVVPVRLAGGKEADAGLAGGEELTDSLASLQAAVARLEDLSGGPGVERVVVGDEAIEASLAHLGRQLAELREAVGAPVVVETDHLGERLAELDAFLRGRDEQVDAKLSELAAAAAPDPAIGERLDRIDAWLREARTVDPEVAERLGRVEALLGERHHVSPDLAQRLDEIEAAARQERSTVDLAPIERRLDALDASLTEALTAPVSDAPTEALAARLEALEQSLGAVRAAVEEPREDPLGEALLGRFSGLEDALGARDLAWEAAAERLGRMEESVRAALDRPAANDVALDDELRGRLDDLRAAIAGLAESRADDERLGRLEDSLREALARPGGEDALAEDLVARLEALQAVVAGLEGSAGEARSAELAERFSSIEQGLEALRGAVESPRDDRFHEAMLGRLEELRAALAGFEQLLGGRDLAWEAAVERLGRLEDSLREAAARAEDTALGETLLGRLAELRAALDARDDADRFEGLEHGLRELRAAVEAPRGDAVTERLAGIEHALGNRDLAWEAAVERLGRLEDSVREALGRPGLGETLGEDLVGRLEALRDVVAGLEGSAGEARAAELAERFASVEQGLDTLRSAVESPRDDVVAERLAAVEHALGGRDLAWEAVAERLGGLEESLRVAVDSPRDDALGERLSRLEEAIREATTSRDDGRLDEVLGRLGDLQQSVAAPLDDALLHRLDGLEQAVRESAAPREDPRLDEVLASLGELRQAVDAPRDHAVIQRLDQLEHTVREATAPREDDRLDEALARLDTLRGALASAQESQLTFDAVRALLDEQREAFDHPDRSGEAIGLLRKLSRESNEASDAFAERLDRIDAALAGADWSAGPDAAAELAERDARIAELVEQLDARPAATPAPAANRPRPGDTTSFLALVPASDGYRLVALEGRLPAAGEELPVPDDGRALVVARLGRSPYPGDARPCAYLQAS